MRSPYIPADEDGLMIDNDMLTDSGDSIDSNIVQDDQALIKDLARLNEELSPGLLSSQELLSVQEALSKKNLEGDLSEAQRIVQSKLMYLSYGEGVSIEEGLKNSLSRLESPGRQSNHNDPSEVTLENFNSTLLKLLLGKAINFETVGANKNNSTMILDLLIEKISDNLALTNFNNDLRAYDTPTPGLLAALTSNFTLNQVESETLNALFPSQELQELLSLGVSKDEDGNSFIEILLNQVIESSNESLFKSFGYSFLDLLREFVRELQTSNRPSEAVSRFVENLEEILETAWFEFSQVFEKGLLSIASAVRLGENYGGESFASLDFIGLINAFSKNIGLPGDFLYSPVFSELEEISSNISSALDASGIKVTSAFYSQEFDQALNKLFRPNLDPLEKMQSIQEMLTADQRIEIKLGLGTLGTLKIKTNTEEGSIESLVGELVELPGGGEIQNILENSASLFEGIAAEGQGDESLAARMLDHLFEANDGFDGDLQNLTLADSSVGGVLFEIMQTIGSTNSDLINIVQAVSDSLRTNSTSVEFEGLSVEEIRNMSNEFEDSFKDILSSDVLNPVEMGEQITKLVLSNQGGDRVEFESIEPEISRSAAKLGFDKSLGEDINANGDFS